MRIKKTSQYIEGGLSISDIYPVGSIYMSINNVNPSTLFGGTWEQIEDRFLLSAGSTYTAGDTGGEATHSHDLSNAYAKLVIGINNKMYWSENSKIYTVNRETSGTSFGVTDSSITSTKAIDLGGNTNESSSMPPYLVVYMWKRTA